MNNKPQLRPFTPWATSVIKDLKGNNSLYLALDISETDSTFDEPETIGFIIADKI